MFHLAAEVRRDRFDDQPHEAFDVNSTGTLAVLNYCYKTGAKCVLMSTSGVYKDTETGGALSEDSPIGPASAYAVSKWIAESACRRQAIDLGVQSVVLRLFNAYGPGQRSSYIVPHVIENILGNTSLSLRMPDAKRDFVHVDDVVEALIKAGTVAAADFSVFNIASGRGTRIGDLVRLCEDLLGKAADIVEAKTHAEEAASAVADIGLAQRELGWSPLRDLRSGLADLGASMAKPVQSSDSQRRLAG